MTSAHSWERPGPITIEDRGRSYSLPPETLRQLNNRLGLAYIAASPENRPRIIETLFRLNRKWFEFWPYRFKNADEKQEALSEFMALLPEAMLRYSPAKGSLMNLLFWQKRRALNLIEFARNQVRMPAHAAIEVGKAAAVLAKPKARPFSLESRELLERAQARYEAQRRIQYYSPPSMASLSQPDDDDSPVPQIAGEDPRPTMGLSLDKPLLRRAREILSPRHFTVMEAYFVHNLSYQEIGDSMSLSRERIRQLIDQAIARLRAVLDRKDWVSK